MLIQYAIKRNIDCFIIDSDRLEIETYITQFSLIYEMHKSFQAAEMIFSEYLKIGCFTRSPYTIMAYTSKEKKIFQSNPDQNLHRPCISTLISET